MISVLKESITRVVVPFQEFISDQKTASLLLLSCTFIALLLANSSLAPAYGAFLETRIGFVLGEYDLSMSLHHWVNDGLMALFFYILGLEIKRELLVGELRDPARDPRSFIEESRELLEKLEEIASDDNDPTVVLAKPEKHAVVERLQETATLAAAPLQLWMRTLEHPVALFVLPLFALVNAGIRVDFSTLPHLLQQPLALGILLGLVVGKIVGISLGTYTVLVPGLGRLPEGVHGRHVIGLGLLGGMGFTMSIFIAGLAFAGLEEQLLLAKTGIITASLLAGVGGYLWLRFACNETKAKKKGVRKNEKRVPARI